MTDLIAHIREVIDQHNRDDHDDGGLSCSCGATQVTDHSGHLARAIVTRLGLIAKSADAFGKSVEDKVRYASALVDEELTVLEGAE